MRLTRSYVFSPLMLIIIATVFSCTNQRSAVDSKKGKTTVELSEMARRDFSAKYLDATRAKILGSYKDALDLFKQALIIDPSNAAAKYEIARIYADNGNFPAAISYAEKAVAEDDSNIWYADFLGQLYAESGKISESITVYRKVVDQYPDKLNYYFSLGNLLASQGKYDDALELYSKLENKIGPSEELTLQRQMIQIEKGDFDAALSEVENLIAQNPEEMRLYGMKAEIYQQQGRQQEAKELYEKMLEMEPSNGLVLLSLYEMAKQSGKSEKADTYLVQAFASSDLSIDVKVNILLNYLSQPNYKSYQAHILQLARGLEAAHPEDAKTFAVQGDLYYNFEDLTTAREKFRRAVILDPNRPPIWQQILTIDSQLNDFESLKTESKEALELFPQQPVFYLFHGVALLQAKQPNEAIETLSTGKNLIIDDGSALGQFYASLGDAYHELSQHKDSDDAYDKALKYNPGNAVVLNNFAYYLSIRGEYLEKAEAMAKKANDLQPDVASFQDTYGWVLYTRQNYQNALFWIKEALKNGGALDPTVLEHHGDVLLKLNKVEEAKQAWKKAIEAGGDAILLQGKIDQNSQRE